PLEDAPGNGMHVHMSLFDFDGNNVFFDPEDPMGCNLSKMAKHFIAGLLKYAPECCLITNQYVNSYKRLALGGGAPRSIAWGRRNRSVLVRIPGYRPHSEEACRIELRSPDAASNPYLAFAVMLAAGLKGVEDELELAQPVEGIDLSKYDVQQLREMGIDVLPSTLGEAVEIFAKSEFMREVLGQHIHEYLVEAKREEWEEYQKIVTTWERDRYLAVL
ncbi:MAG: glutamine synthetase, partial [Eggerthellaceae bacterium]|nr:glutamine synthetase [Eggerthellaceae bacterium]